MEPQIIINPWAITGAILLNLIIGSMWYGPLFGKAWVAEIDSSGNFRPSKKDMIRAMILMIIGALFTAFVLAHLTQIWRPSVWGISQDGPDWSYGVLSALFTWGGFYVPVQLNLVGFELRSWKFFLINSGYQLVSLLAMSMLLVAWR